MRSRATAVEFFFDPMCPFAWQAAKWMREVRHHRGVAVTWRFFSLEEVNREDGKKHPWEREWSYGWSLMRVGAWLRRKDPELLDRWYQAVGSALHERAEQPHVREVAERLAHGIGVPGAVGEALADPTTSEEVRADHEWLADNHGGFGVPTLVFPDGNAFFGPVVVPAPTGEGALRLWDLVTGWLELPHLYELRRPKTEADQAHIGAHFAPYLEARSWRTIQKPAL